MSDFPGSLREFETCFPDDEACARWLSRARWPNGFVCPACGHHKGCELARGVLTYQCTGCRKQTSIRTASIPTANHPSGHENTLLGKRETASSLALVSLWSGLRPSPPADQGKQHHSKLRLRQIYATLSNHRQGFDRSLVSLLISSTS